MTQWLFDLGNTRLKCAALDDRGNLGPVTALSHDAPDFLESLGRLLPEQADSACLASVASPGLALAVLDALTVRFRRISLARSVAQLAGVRVGYGEPGRLGVDRFLALLAAHERGRTP
ncbi:MAG: type III pantothenate kinase, partial [Oxalobacteraceae bacterium]